MLRSAKTVWSLLPALLVMFGCRERPTGEESASKHVIRIWTTESDPATLAVMEDVGRQLVGASPKVGRVEVLSVKWSELNVKLQQAFEAGQMPAVTHLEPFFTKFFVDKDLIVPMDDLVRKLGEEDILPAVRKIAYFNEHYYGIPQHFGASFITYRKDMLDKAGLTAPRTWDEMLNAAEKLTGPEQYGIYFPGADRFFVDAIFFEVLASIGGRAYDTSGKPNLDNERVVQALEYLQKLVRFAPPDWQSATYVEGFPRMVRGHVAIDLFAGARATKTFEDQWKNAETPASAVFHPLEPPHGPGAQTGATSVDCEPFVIINQKKNKGTSPAEAAAIEEAAKRYLELLYRRDNYMKLMRSVPIQLIPIFRSMLDEYAQDPFIQQWRPWYNQAVKMIDERLLCEADNTADMHGRVIFDGRDMTHVRPQDRDVALVSQTWDLLPHLTVRQTLSLPLRLRREPRDKARALVDDVLRKLGLLEKAERRPGELSGGEIQRVALGKLLVRHRARVYLFDECLGSLDSMLRKETMGLVRRVLREQRVTTLWVTHLAEEARAMADQLAVMGEGKILQSGSFEDLELNPHSIEVFKVLTAQTDEYIAKVSLRLDGVAHQGRALPLQPPQKAGEHALLAVRPRGWRLDPNGPFTATVMDCIASGPAGYEILAQIDDLALGSIRSESRAPVGDRIPLSLDTDQVCWFSAHNGMTLVRGVL